MKNTDFDKHILLVDDNLKNLHVMKQIFEDDGINVDIADNGNLAVEKYLESEMFFFDMILLDINMYGMDGYAVTKEIRSCSRSDAEYIKIFAVSANIGDEYKKRAREAGMNGYITKPFDYDKVFDLIENFTNEKKKYIEQNELFKDINKHFVFNGLNIIKSKILLGERDAANTIDDFSTYLRFVFKYLGSSEKINAREIFTYVRAYSKIQEERFEKVQFQYDIETLDFSLSPFVLEEVVHFFLKEIALKLCRCVKIIVETITSGEETFVYVKTKINENERVVVNENDERKIQQTVLNSGCNYRKIEKEENYIVMGFKVA